MGVPEFQQRFHRIVIDDVRPQVLGGRLPAKALVGEDVPVRAVIFREGREAIGADAILLGGSGEELERTRLTERIRGTDLFSGTLRPKTAGAREYLIEAWSDPYRSWAQGALLKVASDVDTELVLAEGAELLRRAAKAPGRPAAERLLLENAATRAEDARLEAPERLDAATAPDVRAALGRVPLRDLTTRGPAIPITVERDRAGRGAWYEFFPRSEGASFDEQTGTWSSGTLATAARRLVRVADMGFDVIYLPPIHPIGRINRKGKNNTLDPGPGDPGSPWAVGAAEGGHDAIHPDLGGFEDFDAFVSAAADLGLEVALDFALQAAPDHPWVTEHPEWFTTLSDGSIAFAENPPKKYEDIYPLNFDNDPEGLRREALRILELWIGHGVKIFRVDNPHTKPVPFWEWLIAQVNSRHPDVVFLAEAFTRPPMVRALAQAGFQQSYTYFTWRNEKQEIEEYLAELRDASGDYLRPNFFVNTPDILTEYLQFGGPPAFKIRAALAATTSPAWGVYAGYELYEHVARPGAEEYIDNEKYEYRPRDFAAAEAAGRSLAPYLTMLNRIRREHPALGDLRNIVLHASDDENVIAFSKRRPARGAEPQDLLIVVINLDPHSARETTVHLDLDALGLAPGFEVEDLVTGAAWLWGEHNYIRLDPHLEPAHILNVRSTA